MAFVQLVSAAFGTVANPCSISSPSFTSTTGNNIIVFCVIGNSSAQTIACITDGTTNLSIASVATSVGGSAVYTGTVTGGGSNAFAGVTFGINGFSTAANNGTFLCTASSVTTLTLSNGSATAQSSTATASSTTNIYQFFPNSRIFAGFNSGTDLEIWYSFNITGQTGQVTQHWLNSGGYSQIYVAEYSGTLAVDTGNTSSGTTGSGSPNSPNVTNTTVYWNDMVIACSLQAGQAVPSVWANGGFGTPIDRTGTGGLQWGEITEVSTPSAVAMLATEGTTGSAWGMTTAAFKYPSGAAVYDWLNAGSGVQLPVVGSVPSAADASVTLSSPGMVGTPTLSEIPAAPLSYSSPMLPTTPILGEIPGFINFSSPTGPNSTPTTATMPTEPYYLIGNMFNNGYQGMPWAANAWMVLRPYLDSSVTWPRSGQEN